MPPSLGKWPPTPPDLNVMDCCFWPHVQNLVNKEAPTSRLELIAVTKKAFRKLELAATRKAIDLFVPRLAKCVAENGGRIEFKMRRLRPNTPEETSW